MSKFTEDELIRIWLAMSNAGVNARQFRNAVAELNPPSYCPAHGEVYAYRYKSGEWYYNKWPGGSKVTVTGTIERRKLNSTEINGPHYPEAA